MTVPALMMVFTFLTIWGIIETYKHYKGRWKDE